MSKAWIILLLIASPALAALEADNVLIVANSQVQGSEEIAQYYARLRGIKPERILKLNAPAQEEITREEFTRTIWEPVRAAVLADESVLAIVPTRGVPLKIKDQDPANDRGAFEGRDNASVDSELMLVRAQQLQIDGALQNPLWDSFERITLESGLVAVARLDAPTIEEARGMAEKALLAETLGAHGRSFLDTGMGNLSGAGYKERDDLMLQVGDVWRRAGIPFDHDSAPEVVDLSTREETLHYYGWYAANQTPAGKVRFRTGGVCVHLHSFSAATVRNAQRNWVGPLLAWGATASYGTVYEPYTVGFPYEHIFWDRLCRGFTFGEAGLIATRLVSWQAVFCGDPLYAPYAQDYVRTQARYRAAVLHALGVKDGTDAPDAEGLSYLGGLIDALRTRQERIETLLAGDPAAALDEFNALRFLVSDMGLDRWVSALAAPFQRNLEAEFNVMRQRIRADLTDTKAFEAALEDWKGLPIHDELVKFMAGLARDQERAAQRLLRAAQNHQRGRRWLAAWTSAAEAAGHAFGGESAAQARAILDEIRADSDTLKSIAAEADRALQPLIDRAQRELDRGRADRADRALGRSWMWYPECEQRKAAEALAAKIRAELEKGE